MATKDKRSTAEAVLPSNADIWGEPAPAFIKASPGTIKLIEEQLAKPTRKAKRKAAKKAKGKRK
jgi:hypothetical protein